MASLEGENEFYLTLLSNSSQTYFPNNTLSNFRTKLPTKIFLSDDWVVGLAEISFNVAKLSIDREKKSIKPKTITIYNKDKTIVIGKAKNSNAYMKLPIFNPITPLRSLFYLMRESKLSKNTFPEENIVGTSSANTLDDELRSFVEKYTKGGNTLIKKGSHLKSDIYTHDDSHDVATTTMKTENVLKEAMDVDDTIESAKKGGAFKLAMLIEKNKKSNRTEYTESNKNNVLDFLANTNSRIEGEPITTITVLIGDVEYGIPLYQSEYESLESLIENIVSSLPSLEETREHLINILKNSHDIPTVKINNNEFVSTALHPSVAPQIITPKYTRELMFVYSDIIKHQLLSNIFARCLRTILIMNNRELYKSFETIQYHPLERTSFDTIEIMITTQNGDLYNFEPSATPTMLVLHFKKK